MPSLNEQYQNLPGLLVDFKEGGLVLRTDPNPPQTSSLLILGTASDGPTLNPVAVDGSTAEVVFGSDTTAEGIPNGSTLLPAFRQAWDAGCRDIRLMRITGKQASATLNGTSAASNTPKRVTEDGGKITGNDAVTFVLANTPIANTVQVVAKSIVLASTAYTVTGKNVQLVANVVDAGAPVQVSYDYTSSLAMTEKLAVSASKTITLSKTPQGALTSVKNGNTTLVLTTDYTVAGSVVTFVGSIAEGTMIDVVYNYSATLHATESGTSAAPFIASAVPQDVTLLNTPVDGSVHLYVNSEEVLNPDAFSVNVATKKVTIKKEFFKKDSTVSITYLFVDATAIQNTLILKSKYSGVIYNECAYEVKNKYNSEGGTVIGRQIILTKPAAKRTATEMPLVYNSTDYPTFLSLVDAINADPSNNVFEASTDFEGSLTSNLSVTSGKLSQGDDGINVTRQELFNALSGERLSDGSLSKYGAYQVLEDYQVDWIVPAGIYADEEESLSGNQSFAYELALFCAVLSYRNKTTFGAIAMKPCKDTSLLGIKNYANYLATYNNNYIMRDYSGKPLTDADGNYIDLGKYISVAAGPEPFVKSALGNVYGNPAISYVAVNTVIPADSSPTNKRLTGAKGLRFRFSNQQLDAITANRIVTFKMKSDRTGTLNDAFIVDGVTAALKGSSYTRITTPKTLKEVVDQVREVADPFIGESNTVEQKNALASAISKRLSILKEKGIIQDYAFQIIANVLDQLLGQARIELTIVPPQELRKITTVVALKPSL